MSDLFEVECLECESGFETNLMKNMDEVIVCPRCNYAHKLDDDENGDGRFWYLIRS